MPGNKRLRIGVMIDSLQLTRWGATLLDWIQRGDYGEIVLLILRNDPPPPKPVILQRLNRRWRDVPGKVTWRVLEWLHYNVLEGRSYRPDPFAKVDASHQLAGIPQLSITPHKTRVSDYVTDDDLERIRQFEPDLLIRLGFRVLRGRILKLPRYGIWSLHHGDHRICRGGPAGFWESMEGWPTTGATLQILTEDLDNGPVLAQSVSAANPWSVRETRAINFWTAVRFMPRKLLELHRDGPELFFQRVARRNQHPQIYSHRLYRQPTACEYARLLAAKLVVKSRNKLVELFSSDQWQLYYDVRDSMSTSLWRFKPLVPPRDRLWADPHILQRDGKYYLFFEECLYAERRGRISVMEIDRNGKVSAPQVALSRDYHLSYPFVFEAEGEVYMIPETAENRTVELYRCTRFPDRWEFQQTLMENVYAVDATLHQEAGRWWMFANIEETPGASSTNELHLFYADDFRTAAWTPHPHNPIVTDVSCARPAGKLFRYHEQLYRPAQDCSGRYGGGFTLQHVQELSTHEYREQTVTAVHPEWLPGLVGTHTFNYCDTLTVIDAQRRRWFWQR